MTDAPAAWIIRSGRSGERDSWALDNGYAGGGFHEVPDLTGATTREELWAVVRAAYPEASDGKVSNFAGQLWALRSRIAPGDTIVLPMKTTSQIAIGVAKGTYTYVDDPDPELRHRIDVEWKRTDVPRTAVHQDLLYSLGAFMTVCQIKRNDGAWRLRQILASGSDPGARAETIDADADDEAIVAGSSGGGGVAAIDLERFSGAHTLARPARPPRASTWRSGLGTSLRSGGQRREASTTCMVSRLTVMILARRSWMCLGWLSSRLQSLGSLTMSESLSVFT